MRCSLLTFFVFLAFCVSAQLGKMNVDLIKLIESDVQKSTTIRVLIKGNIPNLISRQRELGIEVSYHYGDLATVQSSLQNLIHLASLPEVSRVELPSNRKLRPLNDTMRVRNNINPVNSGAFPLTSALQGQGVVIGMIDSGHDYRHPDFIDPQTGKSRIMYIWDQMDTSSGNQPASFGYGREWDSTSFNNQTCTHTDVYYWGHGTHTAGIAGANGGSSGKFAGVAPKADFISVAIDFNSYGPVISDAVNYIFSKSAAMGRPCVINASVGDYYGSHDGRDLQSQIIDAMLQTQGRLLVGAAGNSASYKYHVGYSVIADTSFTWISNGNSSLNFQIYADVNDFNSVNFSVGANAPNFSDCGNIGFKNSAYSLGLLRKDTLFHNGNKIGVVQMVADTSLGLYTLDVTCFMDSMNYLWRFETFGAGRIDSWNFDYKGNNLPSVAQFPSMYYYKAPDSLMTIVSGFQCLDKVITVGNYINMTSWYDVNNNLQTIPYTAGQISGTSSQGPTRDGRMKPDITASGDQILSTGVLSLLPSMITNNPSNVSTDSLHVMGGGTSSSSPVVAGMGALFLEMNPSVNSDFFKNAITQCVLQDNFTGTSLPNTVWGYGKLDGFAAITCYLLNTDFSDSEKEVKIFPNPVTDYLLFDNVNPTHSFVEIFNVQGKMVHSDWLDQPMMYVRNLESGLYFIRIHEKNSSQKLHARFIKN
jgi:hypothetical protein